MVILWWVLVDIFREVVLLGKEARRKRFLGVFRFPEIFGVCSWAWRGRTSWLQGDFESLALRKTQRDIFQRVTEIF